ncbi:MFS transporter [Bhargavaea cecembensis]|uniref:MFS transporter n=1 Tax=Bhargavaea cecembensis TaxID=394098 RepID=UPI00058CC4BB|nr:MFS transporter [Bhargavaea cecembensis]
MEKGDASLLSNRSFLFLWTGQSISMFGLAVYTTCLPFLVFHAGGGAVELSLAQSIFIIPQLVFLLASGVFVDRWPKKRIMMIADLIRSLLVFSVAILLVVEELRLIHVYLLTGIIGLIGTFYRPAVRGITPLIVEKTQLISANSLRSISQQVNEMIGPAIGGFLAASIGLYVAYAINAVTFLLSALLVTLVAVRTVVPDEEENGRSDNFLDDFVEGWKTVRKRGWLGASILIGSVSNVGIAAFDVIILPVYAASAFQGVRTYGLFLSSMAIGALVCAVVIGKINKLSNRGVLYYLFIGLSGVFVLCLSLKPALWLTLLLLSGIGFCLTAFIIIWDSVTQELIDEKLLGRVVSFEMFGGLALLPLSYALFGFLLEKMGVSWSMSLAGLVILAASLLGLANRRVRELN